MFIISWRWYVVWWINVSSVKLIRLYGWLVGVGWWCCDCFENWVIYGIDFGFYFVRYGWFGSFVLNLVSGLYIVCYDIYGMGWY